MMMQASHQPSPASGEESQLALSSGPAQGPPMLPATQALGGQAEALAGRLDKRVTVSMLGEPSCILPVVPGCAVGQGSLRRVCTVKDQRRIEALVQWFIVGKGLVNQLISDCHEETLTAFVRVGTQSQQRLTLLEHIVSTHSLLAEGRCTGGSNNVFELVDILRAETTVFGEVQVSPDAQEAVLCGQVKGMGVPVENTVARV